MMQVGTNQSTAYHSQPSLSTSGGQTGRSSSTSRQQQPQYDNEQLANIRPRLCVLRKWPHYDGYGVHLARNQHWLGLRIGDVEPNSPAESGGLLREDVVLAVNGHSVENDDFFVILSFIQHELEDDQIRFLVLDPHSADLARRNRLIIDENYRTCVRMETPTLTVSPEKLLYDQWRSTNTVDPTSAQNTINLGPTLSLNQQPKNTQRYQQPAPQDGRDDVYTFLPYSDHAVENGKSFFDILFEQDKASSTNHQQQPRPPPPKQPVKQPVPSQTTQESTGRNDDSDDDDDDDDDTEPGKEKRRRTQIKDNVKDFFKSGLVNIKSVLPTKHNDQSEKSETSRDSKSKNDTESLDSNADKTNTATQEKQSQPYERLWQSSSSSPLSQQEDPSTTVLSEARICSVRLRPGVDTIGISLQPDKDFGHIIKQVEANSPADRSGIEKDDCIVSLNDTPLLNAPYEDILNTLKRSRNEPNLDFVVINKYDLLKKRQNTASPNNISQDATSKYTDPSARSTAEVMPSSNITGRNNTSSIPPTQALEQLYNKYTNDQKSSFDDQTPTSRTKETISTSPANDRYTSKQQQQQSGQIYQGVGPATADRSSWGVSEEKSNEDLPAVTSGNASIRSSSQDRRADIEDTKGRASSLEDSFKPLQVGITNPTASQQSGAVSPNASTSPVIGDNQRTSRPTSASQTRDASASPSSTANRAQQNTSSSPSTSEPTKTTTNLVAAVPIAPTQLSTSSRNFEQENPQTTPSSQAEYRLGNGAPISLPNRNTVPVNIYEDTDDDDDLSDISEKSREEDTSEPILTKSPQSALEQKDKSSSQSLQSPTSGVYTPASTFNTTQRTSESQGLTTIVTDVTPQRNVLSSPEKQVVKARRLEQSDSEDTTSASDSHLTKQSGPETFYSPEESADEENNTNNQQVPTLHQPQQTNITPTKPTDNKSNQQQNQDDTEEDEDSNSRSDSEMSSTESEDGSMPKQKGVATLATMPISELSNNGYELHNIQLMQPTETSPVGLKLTKQQNPLQFVITAVAKGTKADLAGLKVNDWLIKIEDKDIRLANFPEVSHEIRQLLTNAGLINMVIARKKTPSSSPVLKPAVKQQTTPSSSIRSESISRQQGALAPTSILTTDITRDTPDNSQVRFTPDQSTSPSTVRTQRSPASNRGGNLNTPGGPLSVGITNPISDDKTTRSPRSQSRSPTREFTVNQQQKTMLNEQKSDEYDPNEIREVTLKEALGLDFNSFIPEGDSQVQTHFISNVQASSMADRAGLRDGDRILTVNGVDVTHSVHEDVRRMMQRKKPLQLTVVNDSKYIELMENVKRSQTSPENTRTRSRTPIKTSSTDSGSPQKSDSRSSSPVVPEELKKYTQTLFTDNDGPVQVKHCILKKHPTYNGYGLLLRYQNGLHLIDQVEENSPAYNAGLREDDVILYVDKKNVEKMTHDDVKILIRTLSLSNTDIDLILIRKADIQRYKNYQQQNKIDWKSILPEQSSTSTIQTEQQQSSVTRSSDDTTTPRKSSSTSSSKQPAPAPPTSASQTNLAPGTRLCTLYPSVDRTAGFALRGKAPPPYIICQIEKDSPAEKAGLLLNDALLSINGKSVADKTYEETVKLIKEALQQKSVELLVRSQSSSSTSPTAPANSSKVQSNMGNQSSANDQTKSSLSSSESNNLRGSDSFADDPSHEGSNAVEQYQNRDTSSSSTSSSSSSSSGNTTKILKSGRSNK